MASSHSDSRPLASVIVPVFRDWAGVPDLITAIEAQVNRPDLELIIVSNDEAAEQPHGLRCDRFVHCAKPGSYAARNHGAAAARGGILIFTDTDCRPEPQWAERVIASVGPDRIVAGQVKMPNAQGAGFWETYDTLTGFPVAAYVRSGYGTTANLGVSARLFAACGGFPTDGFSGGDARFCRAAQTQGATIGFAPDAVVEHPARRSWAAIATKVRRIKGGQLRAGPMRRRVYWALRSVVPPLPQLVRIVKADADLGARFLAGCGALIVWTYGIWVAVGLILGARVERR